MTTKTTHNFPDINYAVISEYEPTQLHVDFKVYEIAGTLENGRFVYGENFSEDPEICEVYLSGSVKWDGCSNWNFDEQDRGVMLHGCSRKDLTDIGEVMARCYDIAQRLIPSFDDGTVRA